MLVEFVYRMMSNYDENAQPLPLGFGLIQLVSVGMVIADFLRFIESADSILNDTRIVNDIWYLTPNGTTAKDFDFVDTITCSLAVMTLIFSKEDLHRVEECKRIVVADLKGSVSESVVDTILPYVETACKAFAAAVFSISGIKDPFLVQNRLRILAVHSDKTCVRSLDGKKDIQDFLKICPVLPELREGAKWGSTFSGLLLQATEPATITVEPNDKDLVAKASILHEGISTYDTIHLAECRYVMLTSFQALTACVRDKYGEIDPGNFIHRLVLERRTSKQRNSEAYSRTLKDLLNEDL